MSSRSGAWWGGKWISSRFNLRPVASRRALYMPGTANTRSGRLALPGQQHRFGMLECFWRAVNHDNIPLAQLRAPLRFAHGNPLAPHRREAHVRAAGAHLIERPAHRPGAGRQHDGTQLFPEGVGIVDDAGAVVTKNTP